MLPRLPPWLPNFPIRSALASPPRLAPLSRLSRCSRSWITGVASHRTVRTVPRAARALAEQCGAAPCSAAQGAHADAVVMAMAPGFTLGRGRARRGAGVSASASGFGGASKGPVHKLRIGRAVLGQAEGRYPRHVTISMLEELARFTVVTSKN